MRRDARLRIRLTTAVVVTTEVPVETLVALAKVADERGLALEELVAEVISRGLEAVAADRDAGGGE